MELLFSVMLASVPTWPVPSPEDRSKVLLTLCLLTQKFCGAPVQIAVVTGLIHKLTRAHVVKMYYIQVRAKHYSQKAKRAFEDDLPKG